MTLVVKGSPNQSAGTNGLCAARSSVAGVRDRTVRSTRPAEAVAELGSLHRSTTMSENHARDRKSARSPSRPRLTLTVVLAAALCVATNWYSTYNTAFVEAEETVLIYVSIYGSGSKTHSHRAVY